MHVLATRFEEYSKSSKRIAPEALVTLANVEEPYRYADLVASFLNLKLADKQAILEQACINKRMTALIDIDVYKRQVLD